MKTKIFFIFTIIFIFAFHCMADEPKISVSDKINDKILRQLNFFALIVESNANNKPENLIKITINGSISDVPKEDIAKILKHYLPEAEVVVANPKISDVRNILEFDFIPRPVAKPVVQPAPKPKTENKKFERFGKSRQNRQNPGFAAFWFEKRAEYFGKHRIFKKKQGQISIRRDSPDRL